MAYGAPIGDPDPTRRVAWRPLAAVFVLLALVALAVV